MAIEKIKKTIARLEKEITAQYAMLGVVEKVFGALELNPKGATLHPYSSTSDYVACFAIDTLEEALLWLENLDIRLGLEPIIKLKHGGLSFKSANKVTPEEEECGQLDPIGGWWYAIDGEKKLLHAVIKVDALYVKLDISILMDSLTKVVYEPPRLINKQRLPEQTVLVNNSGHFKDAVKMWAPEGSTNSFYLW